MPNQPQNLRRNEQTLTGEEIAALNATQPGLGDKIHRILTSLGQGVSAQAGHKGTTGIAKQSAKDVKGLIAPALQLEEDRISGVADPVDDLDAVNLRTLRRLIPEADDSLDVESLIKQKQPCRPIALSNMKTAITGMTVIYAVEAQREFVYVAGVDGMTPRFEVYRVLGDANHVNEMVLVGALTQSEAFQSMFLMEHFILGSRAGGNNLTIIDVKKPNAPVELASSPFNVGGATRGLYAQGRYVFVGTDAGVKIIDIGVPGAPVVRGTAT